jgi:hypothetical protein
LQNSTENYEYVGIIIEKLGKEYVNIHNAILKFLDESKKHILIIAKDHFNDREEFSNKDLKFIGHVYLYVGTSNTDEIEIREHCTKNGLKLILRDEKYWKNLEGRKKPDIFICHDSRYKDYSRTIFEALSKRQVWFDEHSLTVDVFAEEIAKYSLLLGNIFALNSTIGIDQIANKITQIVKSSKNN